MNSVCADSFFFFPNSPLSSESNPNQGMHLNKFYKPYQITILTVLTEQKNPRQIIGNLDMQYI